MLSLIKPVCVQVAAALAPMLYLKTKLAATTNARSGIKTAKIEKSFLIISP